MLCIEASCAGLNPHQKSGNESSFAGELSIYDGNESSFAGELSIYDGNESSFAGELSKEKENYFLKLKNEIIHNLKGEIKWQKKF